jgi:hypothetical protein
MKTIELLTVAYACFALGQFASLIDPVWLSHGQQLFVLLNDAIGKTQDVDVLQHILHERRGRSLKQGIRQKKNS